MSSDRDQVPGSAFVSAFLVLWTLGWSFGVLVFDGFMGFRMAHQLLTVRYSSGPGTITHSEITQSPGTEGPTYKFEVRYTYEANGREYVGSRVSHAGFDSSSSMGEPRALAKRFPVGATVPVFYLPAAPEVSVLLKGLQGSDLFFLMFITPFNLIMFNCWSTVARRSRVRTRGPNDRVGAFVKEGRTHVPLGGREVSLWPSLGGGFSKLFTVSQGTLGGTSIKNRMYALLAEMSPVGAGLRSLGAACLAGCVISGALTDFAPSVSLMLSSWGAVLVPALAIGLWHRALRDADTFDLIVDERRERLSFPASSYTERVELAWSQLQSVTLETLLEEDGFGRPPSTTWLPTVTFSRAGGEGESMRLAKWKDRERAEALVSWLRQRVGRVSLAGHSPGRAP